MRPAEVLSRDLSIGDCELPNMNQRRLFTRWPGDRDCRPGFIACVLKRSLPFVVAMFAAVVLVASSTASDLTDEPDWSRFRGPNGEGVARHLALPEKWTAEDCQWVVELPGSGSSSPVCFADRVFVTSCDAETATLRVQCLDAASGKEIWRKEFPGQPYRMHNRNSFASSTPCVDKDRLYVAFAGPDHTMMVALDHHGDEQWRRDFGPWVSMHGFGTSPMRYGNLVVLHCSQQAERLRPGQQPGRSRMIGVDCRTGRDVWETPLKTTIANYSVPCVRQTESGDELVCLANAEGFFALDPKDGRVNWQQSAFTMRTVASPVIADDLILGSNGTGGGGNYLVAVRPDGDSATEVYRYNQSANYVPTPVVANGLAFLCGDKGIVSCVDVTSGKPVWRERMARGFSGSPVVIGDQVCVMDESGRVLAFEAGRQEPVVHAVDLGEPTRATPSVCGDRVLFRTETHLHCLPARRPTEDSTLEAERRTR